MSDGKPYTPYPNFSNAISSKPPHSSTGGMCVAPSSIAPIVGGIWFPTSKNGKKKCYQYRAPSYPSDIGAEHAGADYCRDGGTEVYAVCSGIVEKNYTSNSNYDLKLLVIKHSYNGNEFWGHYGHIDSSLTEGMSVSGGVLIGTINPTGLHPHLHFGINLFKMHTIYSYSDDRGRKYGWGRTPIGVNPDTVGWRNPVDLFTKPDELLIPMCRAR